MLCENIQFGRDRESCKAKDLERGRLPFVDYFLFSKKNDKEQKKGEKEPLKTTRHHSLKEKEKIMILLGFEAMLLAGFETTLTKN